MNPVGRRRPGGRQSGNDAAVDVLVRPYRRQIFVMIGLLLSSFWWLDHHRQQTLLFAKFRRSMDRFEQVFWSGQSLEELYAELSAQNNTGVASLFVSAMREWKRSFQNAGSSFMGLHARLEKCSMCRSRARSSGWNRTCCFWRPSPRRGPSSACPVGTVWGIMNGVSRALRPPRTLRSRCCPRHRRSPARHRDRTFCGHSGADRHKQAAGRRRQGAGAHGDFRRRIFLHLSRQIDQHLSSDKAA